MKITKELILAGWTFKIKGGLNNVYKIELTESGDNYFLSKCFGVHNQVTMFEACVDKINDNSFTYFEFVMDRKVTGRIYFEDCEIEKVEDDVIGVLQGDSL